MPQTPLPSSGLSPLLRRCALPAATPLTVVPPSLTPLYASLDSSVTLPYATDCRDARDLLGLEPDPSKPSRHPLVGASAETRVSPHRISGSSNHLCLGSVPPSLPPLVHGFPCSNDAIETPRPELQTLLPSGRMCVDRRKRRVLRAKSALPCPPRSSGFCPPLCYQASSALTPQYYPWICHPLLPCRFGLSDSARFSNACGNL